MVRKTKSHKIRHNKTRKLSGGDNQTTTSKSSGNRTFTITSRDKTMTVTKITENGTPLIEVSISEPDNIVINCLNPGHIEIADAIYSARVYLQKYPQHIGKTEENIRNCTVSLLNISYTTFGKILDPTNNAALYNRWKEGVSTNLTIIPDPPPLIP